MINPHHRLDEACGITSSHQTKRGAPLGFNSARRVAEKCGLWEHLVAQGYYSSSGPRYVFTSRCKALRFRMILSLAVLTNAFFHQRDVKTLLDETYLAQALDMEQRTRFFVIERVIYLSHRIANVHYLLVNVDDNLVDARSTESLLIGGFAEVDESQGSTTKAARAESVSITASHGTSWFCLQSPRS
ncbi:hypothetical protein Tco_0016562 [Tanacetum coccineum]